MKIPYARSLFESRRPSRPMRREGDLRARWIARENLVDCLIASPEFYAKHRMKRPAAASATFATARPLLVAESTRPPLTAESAGPAKT